MGSSQEYIKPSTLKIGNTYQYLSHVEEGKKIYVEAILKAFETVPTLVIVKYVGCNTTKIVYREDLFEIKTERLD